jgi:hypothetical protein
VLEVTEVTMPTQTEERDVIVMGVGICAMSVCAKKDVATETIERQANAEHPTGISSRWEISDDETFATGQPNPCPCEAEPDARVHYLLNC